MALKNEGAAFKLLEIGSNRQGKVEGNRLRLAVAVVQ
jgi:hypothetical protein